MNRSIWADPAPEPEKASPAVSPPPTTSGLAGDEVDTHTVAPEDTSAPPADVPPADTFAQTGAEESDLFDDVAPVEDMRIRDDDDLFADDFTPAPEPAPVVVEPAVEPAEPAKPPPPARGSGEAGRGAGRGRGRGRGGYEGRGHGDRGGGSQRSMSGAEKAQRAGGRAQNADTPRPAPPEHAPSGPRKETIASVRGDRHATGGVRKPKLTEEELAEKMAEIQIKNASLTAAHARAEADAASFAEREQQAKQITEQRRKEERRDRQQMMGEREKNRQRKLKAMEGREWDAEKQEDDFRRGGRFDQKGGFAGDQEDYTDGREYLYREPRGGGRKRGAGRGARGGRQPDPAPPKQEDFPALPNTAKPEGKESQTKGPPVDAESTKSVGKSWADQVEASPTS